MRVSERELPVRRDDITLPLPDELVRQLELETIALNPRPLREYMSRFIRELGDYLQELSNAVNGNEGSAILHDSALPTAEQYWQGRMVYRRKLGYLTEDELWICLWDGTAFQWIRFLYGGAHKVAGTIGFQNTWANIGAPWETAGFYQGAHGTVHLEGVVFHVGSPANSIMFTLPAGYRPANSLKFTCEGFVFPVPGRRVDSIVVQANGNVICEGAGAQTIWLDTVNFKARQ